MRKDFDGRPLAAPGLPFTFCDAFDIEMEKTQKRKLEPESMDQADPLW
jgi:hypothetical protein